MSVKRVSRAALVVAILLSGLGFMLASPNVASAAPGKVAAGSPTFTGLGGSLAVGSGGTPVDIPTLHPDRPAQCTDGVDNEVGTRYQNWPGSAYATRNITDANLTLAGTTMTSATAAFTAADLGRTVQDTAGTGGVFVPVGTTIASVTNATTVVLSQGASQTTAVGAVTIRDSIVNAPDGLIDNGSDPQCSSVADDDESMTFAGTGGGFQNSALCDNQTNFPANPQPRRNWSLPSTVTVASAATNDISINPAVVTVPDNVLLQGTTQLAGLQLQVLQNVKPIAFNTNPPRGAYGSACARTFTDGATTSASTTLTSAVQAQFQGAGFQSDIGAFVSGPGIPPNTTVVSRTSATQIVMSQPATATAAGVTVTLGGHGGVNGVTVAASTTFTGNGFSALDIGGLLWSPNVPAGTTIVSVTSGTSVVMSNPATAGGAAQPYTQAARPYSTTCAGGAYVGKTNWFGVSNSDGTGSIDICVFVEINLHEVGLPDTLAPNDVVCRTDAFPIHLTTGTDGALSGVAYDTTRQTSTMVATNFTIPIAAAAAGATLGQLVCDGLNTQVGFPSGPADNALTMVTSTATGPWPPVAAISGPTTINVNEGDLVTLPGDFANSYDPGSRTLTEVGWSQTSGAAPPTLGGTTGTRTYVAQDAPSGGAVHTWNYCVSAPLVVSGTLGPVANTSPEMGCQAVTVNIANVNPVANAGPAKLANGGQAFSIVGSSIDPGDSDTIANRGYCWTETGGTLAASTANPAACAGSPVQNSKTLTVTPPNTSGTLTYSLVVTDKDGGTSVASNVTVTVRATTAGTISGIARSCNPTCAVAAGIPVRVFRDGVGFVGTTTTAADGSYAFPGLVAASYRVQFGSPGFIVEWWNDAAHATEGDAIAPPSSIIDADVYTTGAGTSIGGTVTRASGGTANGTSVRLYDNSGFVAATTTNGSGVYSFTGLQPKNNYKLDFARADAVLAETWSGGVFSGASATKIDNTGGPATVDITLRDRVIGANGQGNIAGTVTDGGSPIAGIQVRAYNFTTGAWVASVTTNGAGAYTFAGVNFGSNVNGLPVGNYKLWFWNVAQSGPGAGQFWCSVWDGGNIRGGQFQGSGKLVTSPVAVNAGSTTTDDKVLVADTTANCPK